jgi:NADP-dependent 3-hydroxy acid dehydrogenase YdfG
LLQQAKQQASLILASLILGESTVFAQQVSANDLVEAKTIVITGANSGIGFEACKRLIVKGHTIILACRSMEKAHDAIDRIQQDIGVAMSGKLIPSECNLADLSSIQKFAADITANYKTDTLCLNAGVARNTAATDCARTKDGFELTGTYVLQYYWYSDH